MKASFWVRTVWLVLVFLLVTSLLDFAAYKYYQGGRVDYVISYLAILDAFFILILYFRQLIKDF